MSDCGSSCGSCASAGNCSSSGEGQIVKAQPHKNSRIKKVIGVVSGKGGVGKSIVTSLLAVAMRKRGYNTAILDSDITGPSIPRAFGLRDSAYGTQEGIMPAVSKLGVKVMSVNLILKNETDPVLWRGPIIAGTVQQFWTDVIYEDVDYMFIDMPPGTGDVALTVFQSLPVDGIIIVTSPQDLVAMIVDKAYNMARMMNIPVIAMVENFSYFHCPDNGKDYKLFGESNIDQIALRKGILAVAKMPINPEFASLVDKGEIESIEQNYLDKVVERILRV